MRDEKRIPEMFKAIEEILRKNTDLRLMQLLINVINPDIRVPHIYYYEDDKLLEELRKFRSRIYGDK